MHHRGRTTTERNDGRAFMRGHFADAGVWTTERNDAGGLVPPATR